MFELLPLAALLGASGFGELINRYKQVLIRKRGSREEGAARGRPKIQITGPKVQPLVCQICLGRIKEGTEYVKCGTGKVFHSVCLARTGTCPFCQRTVAIKGMESTTSVPHSLQFVFLPPEKVPEQPPMPEPEAPPEPAAPEEGRTFVCVSCGAVLEAGTASCACGAIFADPGGSFECPECGAEVREADRSCAVCGAVFEPLGPLICPGCGKEVAPDADVCECGVLLSDKCPECGAHLRESDMACAVCGAEFGHL